MPSDVVLTAVRGVHLAAVLSAFGAVLFRAVVAPTMDIDRQLTTLARLSLAAAMATGLVWLLAQAADFSDADGLSTALAAVAPTAAETRFGHVLVSRLALLLLAWPIAGSGRSGLRALPASALLAAAVASQALVGHAATADTAAILVPIEMAHLLAAGAWLGGLLPLALVVRAGSIETAARAAASFSLLGIISVTVLSGSGIAQGIVLIGSWPALVGTDYGRVALAKIVLLMALLTLAALNRLVLTPSLSAAAPAPFRGRLLASIALETGLGLLAILAAAFLAELTPAIHTQPVWPFPLRPSLDALGEPELREEIVPALAALAAAVLVAAIGAPMRRVRLPCLAGAAILCVLALPHLRPLLVAAYPSSFFQSPTGFTAGSILRGRALYGPNCASCHGADGRGDGLAAAGLPVPPADLTAGHLWAHSDGELFWWLSHGMPSPRGKLAMPGFADRLGEDDIWALIDFIRARNAGVALAATGAWPAPIAAPDFALTCGDGRTLALADLRSRVVRLALSTDRAPLSPLNGVATVTIGPTGPPGDVCVAREAGVQTAYALITGEPEADLDGTELLVDPGGWLRAYFAPGAATEDMLIDAVATIRASVARPGAVHHHQGAAP